MRRPTRSLLAWLALTLTFAGCGPAPLIQVETVVNPDGSCDRSIWQPKDSLLPEGALGPDWNSRWASVADVSVPPAFQEEVGGSTGTPYFHAQGRFDSPAQIPSHFRKTIEGYPEFGSSDLTRSYKRKDYGLFVEHDWSEGITNNVTREGFEKARDAFIEIAGSMIPDGFKRVYGPDFEVSAAVEELKRRGLPLFRDLLDIWYDAAAIEDPKAASEVMTTQLIAALERAGIDLHDAQGSVVSSEEATRRVREHLNERIAATFRHHDGSPPKPEEIEAILSSLSAPPYSPTWNSYVKDRKEELEARLLPLVVRMTGYYAYPPLLQPPGPRFAFAVRLPGEIVPAESNGRVESSGRVSWRFDVARLFPGGFTMTARSVEIVPEAQRRLLGRLAIPDAKAALAIRDLATEDPDVANLLRRAAETGDARLLESTPETDASTATRLDRLKELLGATP
ncbi:hypothetical protein [Planctomyces sp. SH-PL62]|uniref:hypothetical protein n=1 Tax=Planctomyces sp. SH-PL62 TaxID=1636152 RepID=UPI00078B5D61|nr:hypothetical protein [Planctomyces sp. SH-PL62]AMV37240.1 hypothetical protein VT85_07395 [Planctomyces sp. SH-PL62]